ncbi:MAG: NAD-dependent deacetylase [Rhodospirillaceae bacterium TMED167]|mgnify:CR=1 FL=1|nr:NAD-dependent deacetylase [Rhodospirillaceae bacterium]OUW26064.1 MAG: NAD-dependent deacetylase [Rhodospirillaceae bacterium TMED167]
MTPDPQEAFRALLADSRHVVMFTGAGISTESGIPDFRSPGGIWTRNKPIPFQDYIASEEVRRATWRRKFEIDKTIKDAEPNAGHWAIAQMVNHGQVRKIITQNIDGLHQASGVPEDRVIELHGNTTYARCLTCQARHELAPIRDAFQRDETLPVCGTCGGMVKTATISFGQPMPEREMQEAQRDAITCDLFIAIGSSLVVFPAAALLPLAKENGAKLVILNREKTDFDELADLSIRAEIGDFLSNLLT